MSKQKRLKNGDIIFSDYSDFRPNLTPYEIFKTGSFGGTYFRPIKSSITKKSYKNKHKEFVWSSKINEKYLTRPICDKSLNRFKVNSGTSLLYWEEKKWITAQDPYGWVQWYCRFYEGRRSYDDERQINRWLGIAGPKGRFRTRLYNMIRSRGAKPANALNPDSDSVVSPVIQQLLQHWAYRPSIMHYKNNIFNT